MTGGHSELERSVAAQMSLLRDLPVAAPRAECLAQLHLAVGAEAARINRRVRPWRAVQSAVGLAAAFLLALGWGLMGGGPSSSNDTAADSALLNAWVDAADASRRTVAVLIDASWPYDAEVGTSDAEADVDDLNRGFDGLQEIGA